MRNIKRFLAIFLVSLLFLGLFSPFGAGTKASVNTSNAIPTPKAEAGLLKRANNSMEYFDIIIRLKNAPLAKYYGKDKTNSIMSMVKNTLKYVDKTNIEAQQKEFRNFAKAELSNYTEIAKPISVAFNGIFLRVKGNEISKLMANPLVSYIYSSNTYQPLDSYSEEAIGMNYDSWTSLNLGGKYDGTGLKFGVIDTGVDYTHPDLGGDGSTRTFPNAKVVGGYDFADKDNDPYPDIIEYGHGTHVAGIIAARGVVNGIAPNATIYAYKVFSTKSQNGANDITIIEAIDRAVQDGCDVVNMSLGSGDGKALNPETEAINNATLAGVVVVVAAGNSGAKIEQNEFPIGSPSTALNAISVAASNDGPYVDIKIIEPIGNSVVVEGNYFDVSPKYEMEKIFSVVDCGFGSVTEIQATEVSGKVALIQRGPIGEGGLYYRDKVLNAMKAGAVGTIIYNHSPGTIKATLIVDATTDSNLTFIPSITISQGDGLYLRGLIKNGLSVKLSADSNKGTIAEFSSMGVTSDFEFKPDVSAPGTYIYSTYMGDTNKYASLSGTSMAAPCVAAIAGLLKKGHANWTPEEIRLALANTATVLMNTGNNKAITWALQGAGRISVPNAFNTDSFIYTMKTGSEFKYSGMLGKFSEIGKFEQDVFIKNASAEDRTYNVSFNWTSRSDEDISHALSSEKVLVNSNSTGSFSIDFSSQSKKNISFEGIVNIVGGTEELHIPVIIWNGEVKVSKQVDNVLVEKNVFNLGESGTNKISFSLGYGNISVYDGEYSASNLVPDTVIRVYDEMGEKILGTVYNKEMLFMGDYEFNWDGKDVDGKWFLRDGNYKIRVSVFESNNDTKNLQIVEKDYEMAPLEVVGALDSTVFVYPEITGNPQTNWFTVVNINLASKMSLNEISGSIVLDKAILKYDKVIRGDLLGSDNNIKLITDYDITTGTLKFNVKGKLTGIGTIFSIRVNIIGTGMINSSLDNIGIKDAFGTSVNYGANKESVNTINHTMDWDVNGDRIIDIKDLLIIAKAYGYSIGNSQYCPEADINKDGTVDSSDFSKMKSYFGNIYP